MLALGFAVVLAAALMLLAFAASKEGNDTVCVCLFLLAVSALLAGLYYVPVYQVYHAEYEAEVASIQATSEASKAKAMIEELGSVESYLEYLKAIRPEAK